MIWPHHRTEKGLVPADPAIALRIADFIVRTELERLELFRSHLQDTLRRISPLLVDLVAFENFVLKDALDLIYPPDNWPQRPLYHFPWTNSRSSQRFGHWLRASGSGDAWFFERKFANPGVVIRKASHPKGRFAIRPCGSVLGFAAAIGPCVLSAFGSTAILKLPDPLPETFMASLPGRRLNEIVEHPIFAKREYVIRGATADGSDGLPVLAFGARMISFEGPWPALMDDVGART
jgi:hypothetical protein